MYAAAQTASCHARGLRPQVDTVRTVEASLRLDAVASGAHPTGSRPWPPRAHKGTVVLRAQHKVVSQGFSGNERNGVVQCDARMLARLWHA